MPRSSVIIGRVPGQPIDRDPLLHAMIASGLLIKLLETAAVEALRHCLSKPSDDLFTQEGCPGLESTPRSYRERPPAPEAQKDDPKTLKTLFARIRASLSFRGFRTGELVHQTEAQKLRAQMARARSTIPPKHLRDAKAAALAELRRIQQIRDWERTSQEVRESYRKDLGLLDENYLDREDPRI